MNMQRLRRLIIRVLTHDERMTLFCALAKAYPKQYQDWLNGQCATERQLLNALTQTKQKPRSSK